MGEPTWADEGDRARGDIADGHDEVKAEGESKLESKAWYTDDWQQPEGAIALAGVRIRIVPWLLVADSSRPMVCGKVERFVLN